MSAADLSAFFAPRSVAVIGASDTPGSLGEALMRSLLSGGFGGALLPVNPKRSTVGGIACRGSVSDLPEAPELAIIAIPAAAVPGVVQEAARRGVKGAIILSAGLGRGEGSLAAGVMATARAAGMRIIGPNCLGVLSPHARLNASFAPVLPKPGSLAVISQSGAIAAGVASWAALKDVGLSGAVSFGEAMDLDFADCLEHFTADPATSAILLYIESIHDAGRFLQAAKEAATRKPVIVLKSGRQAEGARAAATHTGALAGSDAVYDAAFRRAGLMRVDDLDAFFAAAEALSRGLPRIGERLAILTNGGGLGVLTVDALIAKGGKLAALSADTIARLDAVLPPTWSRANPVDIIGDARPERYAAAIDPLFDDPGVDAVLIMNCPTAVTSGAEAAQGVVAGIARRKSAGQCTPPVLALWLGADAAVTATLEQAGIPCFATEAEAVLGCRALSLGAGVHGAASSGEPQMLTDGVDGAAARAIISTATAEGRKWLTPAETVRLLEAYGVPVTPIRLAQTAEAAGKLAQDWLAQGLTCTVKIQSPDIQHKSDVDGVRLNLASEAAVARARRHSEAGARGPPRRADRGRQHPADDPAAKSARTHHRHGEGPDLRADHPVRARRHGGGGGE